MCASPCGGLIGLTMTRAEVEAALAEEDAVLGAIVRLVRGAVPWRDWPSADRDALSVALRETGLGDVEAGKARALARHLFGPMEREWSTEIPARPSERTERNAERVRADLAAKVPLRAGLAILRER